MTELKDRTINGRKGPLYNRDYPFELRLSKKKVKNCQTSSLDFNFSSYFSVIWCFPVLVEVAHRVEVKAKQYTISNDFTRQ